MSHIGDEVRVKDEVFVLHHGKARVESRTPDDGGFNVRLAGHGVMHYSRTGCPGASTKRVVYWHDPLLIEPPRDPALWAAFVRMATVLYNDLSAWRKEGWEPGEGSD
jgi:hypothetical protein